MTQTNKREWKEFKFKIYKEQHGFNTVWDGDFNEEMKAGEYHVIEYKALQAEQERNAKLQKELDEARAEVERLKRALAHDLMNNDENGTEFCYVMALKDQITELLEALEKIKMRGSNCTVVLASKDDMRKIADDALNKFGRGEG